MGSAPQPAPSVDVEYLKMIESVIDRLAQNSFTAKNWSVGLITALLAFSTVADQAATAILAFFPAIGFCLLDVFYLRQERLFRALYRAASRGETPNFSMETSPYEDDKKNGVLSVMASPAIWLVHGVIMVLILLVLVVATTFLSSAKGQG